MVPLTGPLVPRPLQPDMGSCGNACCGVVSEFALSPDALYNATKAFLMLNEAYSYVTGPDDAGHNPGDDLSPYPIPWDYVFQGTHITTGGYIDVINFNIRPAKEKKDKGKASELRAFSVANIHGALGDNGQTYKTLEYLLAALHGPAFDSNGSDSIKPFVGCGSKFA